MINFVISPNNDDQETPVMANFLLYKYLFEKTLERSLFSVTDGESLTEELLSSRLYDVLNAAYHSKNTNQLNLFSIVKNRKGETEPESYANSILNCSDAVALIAIRNNKVKKVMPIDSNEEKEIGHYPICLVIIDTRPGSAAILVQQKSNCFANTDMVIEIIESYISRALNLVELNWKVSTEKRICEGKIWDIVRTRISGGHDRVKSVTFKFNDKRKADETCAVDIALRTVLSKLASPDGELKLTSDDPAKKLLDETIPDVVSTVDMLIENEYHITVGFDKSGSIEYGKNADAVYGVDDRACEQFRDGEQILDDNGKNSFEMIQWLNKLMPDDSSHGYTPRPKRKRRNKNVS